MLVLVDDARWLDQVSLQTLEFVARRPLAEPVAMAFAVRDPEGRATLGGLPTLPRSRSASRARRGRRASSAAPSAERLEEERVRRPFRGRDARRAARPARILPAAAAPPRLAYGLDSSSFPGVREPVGQARVEPRLRRTARAPCRGDPHPAAGRRGGADRGRAPADPGGHISAHHPGRRAGQGGRPDRVRRVGPVPAPAGPIQRSTAARNPRSAERPTGRLAEATDRDADPDRRAWHAAQAADRPDEAVAAGLS
ncbi:hypothetical protein ACU686_11245 [Yinghuangia aomiensis]